MSLFPRVSLAIMLLALAGGVAHAQNATTTPVGVVNVRLDANRKTALSIPLEKAPAAFGNVTAVTSTTITDSAASFGSVANSHFVRILTGNAAGRLFRISAGNATSLTLQTGSGNWLLPVDSTSGNTVNVAVGDRFEVVPMWTMGEVFGTDSVSCVLRTATNPNNADQVAVYVDGTLLSLFNNGTNWRNALLSSDNANYNTYGLLPTAGMWVTRRSTGTNAQLQFVGNVPDVSHRYHMPGGARFAAGIPLPAGATLGTLSLGNMTSWVRNNNPNNADQVTVYRPDNSQGSFFLNSLGVWRNVLNSQDNTDYASLAIPPGSGIWITRRGTATGTTANVRSVLPYSVQ